MKKLLEQLNFIRIFTHIHHKDKHLQKKEVYLQNQKIQMYNNGRKDFRILMLKMFLIS